MIQCSEGTEVMILKGHDLFLIYGLFAAATDIHWMKMDILSNDENLVCLLEIFWENSKIFIKKFKCTWSYL